MGKFDRVKKRTKHVKKRKGFMGIPSWTRNVNTVNNMNLDSVNFVHNESSDLRARNDEVDDIDINNAAATSSKACISSQKLESIDKDETTSARSNISGNRIIDTEILSVVFSKLMCPDCNSSGSLYLGENYAKKYGLCSELFVSCKNCNYQHDFYTSNKCGKIFDINNRSVYTFRTLGHGHSGLEKFTALMNMPSCMTANNYNKLATNISQKVKTVAMETMSDAVQQIRESAGALEGEVVDTEVSGDGSWQKRGYSSNNGVVTVISLENGKVLDVEPMSKHCKACCLKEPLKQSDPVMYANWRNSHVCSYNYKGSAPGMEPEGAKRIFERSLEKYNLRYIKYLGDGDSKSYLTVKNVYKDIEVQKLECVGHYQKRVGTRLRKLKKTTKSIGGRGKLTDATIDRLQNFFGMAIRQNAGNLKKMQAATQATLFHVASSAKNNWHYPHCPEGSDSWCRYNQDKANNTCTYKPGPGLPLDIVLKLKPIFNELSSEQHLQKCLHGRTQNQNESFNAMIWERIPKSKYVALTQLEFGVYDAVANFNIGRKASVLLFEMLNMIPGVYTVKGCQKLNSKRLSLSTYKNNEKNKLRRKKLRGKKHQKSDKYSEKEGELYLPGGF